MAASSQSDEFPIQVFRLGQLIQRDYLRPLLELPAVGTQSSSAVPGPLPVSCIRHIPTHHANHGGYKIH